MFDQKNERRKKETESILSKLGVKYFFKKKMITDLQH